MVLLDTSIWIEFLRKNPEYFGHVRELLESGSVHSVEAVFAELLQGARGKREVDIIISYWNNINNFNEKGLWIQAGLLSQKNKWFNKGVGIIDAMILSYAGKYNIKIWSLDKKLLSILNKKMVYHP